MADNDNRTMPPSMRRRREAREQGQVAQSRLLRTAGQLLVLVVAGSWLLSNVIEALAGMMRSSLAQPGPRGVITGAEAMRLAGGLLEETVLAVLPLLLVAAVAALLMAMLQTGWLWAPGVAAPRWERLSPSAGLGRLFGGGGVVRLISAAGQLAIIVGLGGWYVADRWPLLWQDPAATGSAAGAVLSLLSRQGLQLVGEIAVALLVIGGLDWLYQRRQFEQQLKMTPEEWRAEQRLEQGDRRLAGRRRRRPRQTPPTDAPLQGHPESVN